MTPQENYRKLLSATKADNGRPKGVLLYFLSATIGAIGALAAYQYDEHVTSLGFFYGTIALTSLSISQIFLKTGVRNGQQYWRQDGRRVVLTTTHILVLWELGPLLLTSFSFILGIILFPLKTQGEWIPPAMLLIIGTIGTLHLIPILKAGAPSRRRISLNRTGIDLTRIDGHTDEIPWKAHPQLAGVRQGDAIITLKGCHELRYPVSFLPMSMRQLERILNTFSTSTRLRAKLSGPEALSTVLAVLEPTEEELTDGSWTWRTRTPSSAAGHETE